MVVPGLALEALGLALVALGLALRSRQGELPCSSWVPRWPGVLVREGGPEPPA